jgi:hypothetical protein
MDQGITPEFKHQFAKNSLVKQAKKKGGRRAKKKAESQRVCLSFI